MEKRIELRSVTGDTRLEEMLNYYPRDGWSVTHVIYTGMGSYMTILEKTEFIVKEIEDLRRRSIMVDILHQRIYDRWRRKWHGEAREFEVYCTEVVDYLLESFDADEEKKQ